MDDGQRPLVGITLGDPAGVGPEIILQALGEEDVYEAARPLVIGDRSRSTRRRCSSVGYRTWTTRRRWRR